MSPEEAENLFSEAYEKELSPEVQAAFDAVLEEHPALAADYEAFCGLFANIGLEISEGETPDLLAGVQAKLRQRSRGRYYRDRPKHMPKWTPILIALVTFLVLGTAFFAMGYLAALS